jgi:hypothetical protein
VGDRLTPPVLARWQRCWHYASMGIQINIRDVPEKVRDELAARAALQGKSMQEFLRAVHQWTPGCNASAR